MEKFAIYEQMLKNELIVATGCTEPIALSLAGAKLVETLKGIPTHIDAYICGNIIKNAKSVTVPNTNGLKGLKAAIAAGVAVGDSKNDLEILSSLKENLILFSHIFNNLIIRITKSRNYLVIFSSIFSFEGFIFCMRNKEKCISKLSNCAESFFNFFLNF